MKIEDLSLLMHNAVNARVAKAVAEMRAVSPIISKPNAYHIYGQSNVDRWLTEHLISPCIRPGKSSKRFHDRIKLDGVAASSNRHAYLQLVDR